MASGTRLGSFAFTVFGKVQGVFFRKCTAEKASELGLVGWVKNEPDGTVIGVAQGAATGLAEMRHWLQHTGSPASRIDRCEVRDEVEDLEMLEFTQFTVLRRGNKPV